MPSLRVGVGGQVGPLWPLRRLLELSGVQVHQEGTPEGDRRELSGVWVVPGGTTRALRAFRRVFELPTVQVHKEGQKELGTKVDRQEADEENDEEVHEVHSQVGKEDHAQGPHGVDYGLRAELGDGSSPGGPLRLVTPSRAGAEGA